MINNMIMWRISYYDMVYTKHILVFINCKSMNKHVFAERI